MRELAQGSATTITPADFDNDGVLDLAVPHRDGGQSFIPDLSDPTEPHEVSRYPTPGYSPHWASADPRGPRVVVTSDGPALSLEILIFNIDPETGALTLDPRFGSPSFPNAGVSFDRQEWPHGEFGPALAHAALFGN